jgi:hypothetical protein
LIDARELQVRLSTSQLFGAGKDAVNLTLAGIGVAMVTRPELRDTFFDDVVVKSRRPNPTLHSHKHRA